MATTDTLLQLRNQIRERCDMVTSAFITDTELNSYINKSYFELYDLLVQKYGDNYYVAVPLQISTDGVSNQFRLPDGVLYTAAPAFYKFLGLDLFLSPNNADSAVSIPQFNFADRNRYAVPNFQSFYGVTNLRYRLNDDNLWLIPTPQAGQTLQLWYVPRLEPLVADGDTADGISGWNEYIIADCCIKCLAKEESDTSVFVNQKAALIQRIENAAENRDAGNPATIADTQSANLGYPTSGSGDGWGGA